MQRAMNNQSQTPMTKWISHINAIRENVRPIGQMMIGIKAVKIMWY